MALQKITTNAIAANSVGIAQLAVADGSDGHVLKTNGSGTLSFGAASGGGGSTVLSVEARSGSVSVAVTSQNLAIAARSGTINVGV